MYGFTKVNERSRFENMALKMPMIIHIVLYPVMSLRNPQAGRANADVIQIKLFFKAKLVKKKQTKIVPMKPYKLEYKERLKFWDLTSLEERILRSRIMIG